MSQAKQALIATLNERFPKAFPTDPQAIRPLKIGIDADIRQAGPELNEKLLRQVLAGHTQRYSYLKALARGGQRLDLQGNPVEAISAAACAKAKEKLKDRLNPERKEVQPKAQEKPKQVQNFELDRKAETKPVQPPVAPRTVIHATVTRSGRPVLTLNGKR